MWYMYECELNIAIIVYTDMILIFGATELYRILFFPTFNKY